MRLITLMALMLFSLSACSQDKATPVFETPTSVAEDTEIAAVMIHADWCSSCKIMEPKLREVRNLGPIDGVQFLTIDYTSRDKNAFFATAKSLGVDSAIREAFDGDVTTGVLLLVDKKTGALVDDLRKELTADALRERISTAAKNT